MMAHLDYGVDRGELQETVEKPLRLGTKVADVQHGGDEWITMIDPSGHPFCILIWE